MMNALISRLAPVANRVAPWVLFVFITLFAWFLAAIIWFMLAPPKAQNLTPVDLPANQINKTVNGSVFSLFSQSKAPNAQSVQTNTNFKLQGVFLASPNSMSAVVLDVGGMAGRYKVGDKIGETDYKLVDVEWDKAWLENGLGKTIEVTYEKQRLELNQRALLQSTTSSASRSQTSATSSGLSGTQRPNGKSSSTPKKPKLTKKQQLTNELNGAIDQLRSNPSSYLSKMGVMATGDGYKVTSAMNRTIRSNIGLQSGDKVISVNGQPIGQPQQDAMLLEEVQRSGSAEIQVQRGDQVITIRQQF